MNINILDNQRIEAKQVKEKEIKYKLDNVIIPHPNQPIFEINVAEQTIRKAELKPIDTVELFANTETTFKNRDIVRKDGCEYKSALNIKNLIRKYKEYSSFAFIQDEESEKVMLNKNRKIQLIKIAK